MKVSYEGDEFEIEEHIERLVNYKKSYLAIVEFSNYIRSIIKHTDEQTWPNAEQIRDKLFEFANNEGADF